MILIIVVPVFIFCLVVFLGYFIRDLGKKHQFFTTYPRQGTIAAIEDGGPITNVLDGDSPPNSLLYALTKTWFLGLYKKRKPIPWEMRTLKFDAEGKAAIGVETDKSKILDSIPKLFPLAIFAPITAGDSLHGEILTNFTFKVDKNGEKEFLLYITNTPDWLDTLQAPLIALQDEYAKTKGLKELRNEERTSLQSDFQVMMRKIADANHKVYRVMHLVLVSADCVDIIEKLSPEMEEAFEKKVLYKRQNEAELEKELGQAAILAQQLVNANQEQQIKQIEVGNQKYYTDNVTIPILNAGGDLTTAAMALKDTHVTTFAVGTGTVALTGNNIQNSPQPKNDKTDEEKNA